MNRDFTGLHYKTLALYNIAYVFICLFLMNWTAALVIAVGAVIGAWLRWGLGVLLNPLLPQIPLGTLVANLSGGLLIGMTVELFHHHADLPRELWLFLVTGLLGGFTTFSSFSAEVVALIRTAQYGWALLATGAHVFGALLMTALGIVLMQHWLAK